VKEVSGVGHFLKEKAHLIEKISQFTDIRKNPQIKLNHIVLSVLLMPFYSVTSLLGLDRLSRKQSFKKVFGCTRKMVASDSTVNRALRWLDSKEVQELQRSFLPLLEQQHLSKIQLAPDRPSRRIGILDGSQMGQHHVVAFDLCGKIDYPLMVSNAHSRGKELPVARQIVENAAQVLQDRFPQLFLLDSLYFNQPFFDCIRSKGAHLLIKSDEPSFREVLMDAKFVFENKKDLVVPVEEKQGFDEFRVCSWRIEKTSGVFAGYPSVGYSTSNSETKCRGIQEDLERNQRNLEKCLLPAGGDLRDQYLYLDQGFFLFWNWLLETYLLKSTTPA